jgi:pimeloyl-ACP methyl ester carboxylesterase
MNMIEKLISVPIDSKRLGLGKFDLYYFVRMPETGRAQKTVLFCAGGPGAIIHEPMSEITHADFLTQNGYNVVFFHQRGAGFSQLPPSNRFDRFLKTQYAVEDIEAIRRDFLGEDGKWDAVIGWSYGTVVAQQYVHYVRSYHKRVEKLVLIGPMSRHEFASSADVFDKIRKEIRDTDRYTLGKIYDLPEFADLTYKQKRKIFNTVFTETVARPGILDRAEQTFGSLGFVIDSYCELKRRKQLQNYDLDKYSREFFEALRGLHIVGSRANVDDNSLVLMGKRIKEEIVYSNQAIDDCTLGRNEDLAVSSKRAYYVIHAYDGINMRFLWAWLRNGKARIWDALRKSGGDANDSGELNNYLEKIGISDSETIEPWDPAHYQHDTPTLILKGDADTVPAGDAAMHVFRNASTGPRTLIRFPDVGHKTKVPDIALDEPILTGTVRLRPSSIRAGETREVLGIYSGRNLNDDYQVELKTTDQNVQVAGFGIRGKNNNGLLEVVALIENRGNQLLDVKDMKWIITNRVFSGIVDFESRLVEPQQMAVVFGKIGKAWLNGQHAVHVNKPNDLEPGLEYLCSSHIKDKADEILRLWIENDSKPPIIIDDRARTWTLSTDKIITHFSVDPPAVEPQIVDYSEIKLPSNFEFSGNYVMVGNGLMGCIQEDGESRLSTILFNPTMHDVNSGTQEVTINNSAFSRTYQIDHPEIPSRKGFIKDLSNLTPSYDWKEPSILKGPLNSKSQLELLGWRVTSENKMLMLVKNGQSALDDEAAEWIYIDPNDDKKLACVRSTKSTDCLIYSFLVLSPETFKNERYNRILEIMKGDGAIVVP